MNYIKGTVALRLKSASATAPLLTYMKSVSGGEEDRYVSDTRLTVQPGLLSKSKVTWALIIYRERVKHYTLCGAMCNDL